MDIKIKNIFLSSAAALLIIIILAIAYSFLFGPAKSFSDSLLPARSVTLVAEGKVTVSPDIAKLSFAVVSEGKSPESIADDNNKKINKAVTLVKSLGVEEKDIKTTNYNLSPRYEYNEKARSSFISGYTLTQTVLIKVRDFSKVPKILAALPGLGINQIDALSFDIDNPEKYLAEARSQAFDKALTKAKEMADKTGVKIGRVLNFSESQSGIPIPRPMYGLMKADSSTASVTAPNILPGSQEVSLSVSITYEIK